MPKPEIVWKDIPGWEGLYMVSDTGLVKSFRRGSGRILKPCPDHDGYPHVTLCYNNDRKTFKTAKLVLLAFIGFPAEGLEIRHLNGDASDSNLSNLVYGTHSQNTLDKVRHGTFVTNQPQTECIEGHRLVPDNLYYSVGKRRCKTCKLAYGKRKTAARRSAV